MNNEAIRMGNKLRKVASKKQGVYLVPNQINSLNSCFVIHHDPRDFVWFDQNYDKAEDFKLYLNPKINKFIGPFT